MKSLFSHRYVSDKYRHRILALLLFLTVLYQGLRSVPASEAGVIPVPVDMSRLNNAKLDESYFRDRLSAGKAQTAIADEIPASYDLVALGLVTPVSNQRRLGTCWSFAALESIESSLLKSTKQIYDLSELHLAWFAYSQESPKKTAFTRSAAPGENPVLDNGGSFFQVMSLLSRGTGPAYESDAPYPVLPFEDAKAWAAYVPSPLPYAPAQFRLKEAAFIMETDDVKRALLTHGGLDIAFCISNDFRDDTIGTFFLPFEEFRDGHAVMLVGWDDNYSRHNFKNRYGIVPERNGAWKIQNSWGAEIGDRGYYWISYEDRTIMKSGAFALTVEPLETYDGIYFHDPLGLCDTVSIPESELDMANVFVAERDEKIVSVGFFTMNTNLEYEIQVHKNLSGNSPATGIAALPLAQRGKIEPAGYHSIKLTSPVSIGEGEKFAVIVSLKLTNTSDPSALAVPYESAEVGYSENATANPGESYTRKNGVWKDIYEESDPANFCIKAFTVKSDTSPSGGSSSSGGCSAGGLYGMAILLVALPSLYRVRGKGRGIRF